MTNACRLCNDHTSNFAPEGRTTIKRKVGMKTIQKLRGFKLCKKWSDKK